jgi:biotin synthase-like enzyme
MMAAKKQDKDPKPKTEKTATKTPIKQPKEPITGHPEEPTTKQLKDLIAKAEKIFLENHTSDAAFERAIFFSWYCAVNDCKFCYMSTQPKTAAGKLAVRSTESLLAETIITRELGWQFGFFSGGISAKKPEQFLELLKQIHSITGQKIWINIGPVPRQYLEMYRPYIQGVVGSIETINPKVHKFVCPSKPTRPYLKMFSEAEKLGLKKAITIILGLGETIEDFPLLEELIKNDKIDKIHLYNLIPHPGTYFGDKTPPTPQYQAEWIAKTRIAFPKLDIQAGVWDDKVKDMNLLLRAGANSISKFPALKKFGSKPAEDFEKEVKTAGRKMVGTLTKMPKKDWDKIVDDTELDPNLKIKVKAKLKSYLKTMQKSESKKAEAKV